MAPRPKQTTAEKEITRLKGQFDQFEQEVKDLTLDAMNKAPVLETEMQVKMSNREIQKCNDIYLKPNRSISSREKFNEKFREQYNYAKEYVPFIAEHNENKGEMIETWTKRFPGQPAEFWQVPVNKPVWGPRYLAERIKACTYHRLSMDEKMDPSNMVESGHMGNIYGRIVADHTVQRLDARPVTQNKSIFMGAGGF